MSTPSPPSPAHGQGLSGPRARRGFGASAMNLLRRGTNNPPRITPTQQQPSAPPPTISEGSSLSPCPSTAPLSPVLKKKGESSKSPTQTRITFAETTTSAELTDLGGSSTLSSASASSSRHLRSDIDTNFIRGAPTPYNTMADSQLFAEETIPGTINSYGPMDEDDGLYPAGQSRFIGQRTDNTVSSYPYTLSSTASHDYIPQSTRPVPAPPQVADCPAGNPGDVDAAAFIPLEASRTRASDTHSKRFVARFRRPKVEYNRDALRLQQLGYDPVLGRDYTFWSSFFISWISIGCLQVSTGGAWKRQRRQRQIVTGGSRSRDTRPSGSYSRSTEKSERELC